MTYEAFEEGPEGYPIELYKFSRGLSEEYLYTSSDQVVTYLSQQYLPIQISRGKIEINAEIERAPINIDIQRDADILDNFVQFPPTEIISVTVSSFHQNDTPTPEVVVVWKGRVLAADWQRNKAVLECEPVFTSLKRPGLRRKFAAQCPHVLYGPKCKVDRNTVRVTDTLTGVANNVITATAFAIAVDHFAGGYIQFATKDFRTVIADDGAGNLTLSSSLPGLEVGSSVDAFPGCAHDLNDCVNRYNNLINYGGFPYVPRVNPFGGTSIF